jgi:hypothetical protein
MIDFTRGKPRFPPTHIHTPITPSTPYSKTILTFKSDSNPLLSAPLPPILLVTALPSPCRWNRQEPTLPLPLKLTLPCTPAFPLHPLPLPLPFSQASGTALLSPLSLNKCNSGSLQNQPGTVQLPYKKTLHFDPLLHLIRGVRVQSIYPSPFHFFA